LQCKIKIKLNLQACFKKKINTCISLSSTGFLDILDIDLLSPHPESAVPIQATRLKTSDENFVLKFLLSVRGIRNGFPWHWKVTPFQRTPGMHGARS